MPEGAGSGAPGGGGERRRPLRRARLVAPAHREPLPVWRRVGLPSTETIQDLFIPTGRHSVRLNWHNPLAVPLVVLVVLASPLLLMWALVLAVAGRVARLRQRWIKGEPT
jgi:hypothetical protein